MESLPSSTQPASKSASISATCTPDRNNSIEEDSAVELACGNRYGICYPREQDPHKIGSSQWS
eukprot:7349552-Ditylum_brightwellii.AAC.1